MNDNIAPYGAQQQPSYDGTQGTHTMGQQWMQPQPAKKDKSVGKREKAVKLCRLGVASLADSDVGGDSPA